MNDNELKSNLDVSESSENSKSPISIRHKFRIWGIEIQANSKWVKVIFSIISFISFILFAMSFYPKIDPIFHPTKNMPQICVLCPDPSLSNYGSFYQDGIVQKNGFDKAIQDANKLPNQLKVTYSYFKRESTPEAIIDTMKSRYQNSNSRYFVMTMSTKLVDLRNHFINWYNECKENGKPLPILIATVASAPDIADISNGIVRWYIRSEEESTLLAQFLIWKENVNKVGIFYITKTPGQADDLYGLDGMKQFKNQFLTLGGISVDEFATTTQTAKKDVTSFISKHTLLEGNNNNKLGVFIVGYGDMVKEILTELISQNFWGPITCASTLTEPDWQPQSKTADNRIFTILPRFIDSQVILPLSDKNVVFYFSRETLYRVLEITSNNCDSKYFLEQWMKNKSRVNIDQEMLYSGDCIIKLKVANMEEWR